jgi:hypothetical protein
MTSLPPAIFFVNGDISYPSTPPIFIGSIPSNPRSYAGYGTLLNLQTQLFIDDIMTKEEFDGRVAADPNYPTIVHLRGFRILVIVPSYNDGYCGHDHHDHDHDQGHCCGQDGYHDGYHHHRPCHHPHINIRNIHLADVVMFFHQGVVDVEFNRFGPPLHAFDAQRITMYELLRAAHPHSHSEICVPFEAFPRCGTCDYPFYCDTCHTFSGIRICRNCGGGCKCGCGCGLIDNQGIPESPVHLPNCDNEFHNWKFIHRK